MQQQIRVKFKLIGKPKNHGRPYIPKARKPKTPRRPVKLTR